MLVLRVMLQERVPAEPVERILLRHSAHLMVHGARVMIVHGARVTSASRD